MKEEKMRRHMLAREIDPLRHRHAVAIGKRLRHLSRGLAAPILQTDARLLVDVDLVLALRGGSRIVLASKVVCMVRRHGGSLNGQHCGRCEDCENCGEQRPQHRPDLNKKNDRGTDPIKQFRDFKRTLWTDG
ncbi:MAG: hypothetical protein J0H65_18200, partial [Rhizobiales bacterium]|nr:hypothetical protein [Hyphomicrobiales bacterium]